ncbi:MAG: NAD(P)/FAD-dependent oxidoreductase [Alphaproteobacteria bacterium]|jgi:cation diffusion facilitator CzcD-associated flavoprotein CzcO|nr:NAD(P)/FAD-dependent oxidoreductase [Alphaproteobacteria bacterium]
MSREAGQTKRVAPETSLRVAVIGAGMSGILSAIKLREAGIDDVTVYEKADRLGGTWRDNTYPGLSCDVPSHLYRYRFEPNPDWSYLFSPGAEIQAYLEQVAAKHGVEAIIRYDTEVTKAAYADGRWRLETRDGAAEDFDFVIAATGVLRDPVYPDIEGLASFAGASFHSARWNHDVGLDGKRVGIIGTGSTAIQIVPAIVDRVAKVSLFQRTAQWILPLANPAYTEAEKAEFRSAPELMEEFYQSISERFANSFARAVVGDAGQMRRLEEACEANLVENVHDSVLREQLTPDYKVACKRLIMSDNFYPAIQKPNADLVTAGIVRIEPEGVRTRGGVLHPLDVVVLATGFDAHRFMRPMTVVGRDGVSLDEVWAEANEAYRSVAIPGFPNFFMLVGPNSPIGNFSLIQISEMQLDYILQLVDLVRAGRCRAVAPRHAATRRFNAAIKEAMGNTVWVSGCQSWYLDRNGNPAMWPWTFDRFRDDMRHPDLDDFDLVA